MRLYELAKSLDVTSAELLEQAVRLDLDARTALAALDDDEARRLRAAVSEVPDSERAASRERLVRQRTDKTGRAAEARTENAEAEAEALRAAIDTARALDAQINGPAPEETPEEPAASEAPESAPEAPPADKPVETPAESAAEKAEGKGTSAKPPKTRKRAADEAGEESAEAPLQPSLAARVARESESTARRSAKTRGREEKPSAIHRPRFLGSEKSTPPEAPPAAARKPAVAAPGEDRKIFLRGPVVVKDFAEMLGVRPNQIIAELMKMNVLASINQRIDFDMASKIADRHGFTVEMERARRSAERKPTLRREDEDDAIPEDRPEDLRPRPPVVTFLGHVDHGKTSLLDRICGKKVASGEAGGITQHIGAFTVEMSGRRITFLDTPGHAAFSAMRARGANLTDIAVIVIAADDGIMPQTREAIRYARQAEVTLMIAINKIDLPGANPDRIRQQLQGEGLTPEEWGGDLICCEVSAVRGDGIDHLLEMILLQADVLELSANPDRRADGHVVEARLEQGRGPTATLLVGGGTLKVGDVVLCGEYWGKVRALVNDQGKMVKSAGPGIAVQVLGLSGVPEAGSEFAVMLNDKRARALAEAYAERKKSQELASSKASSLDDLMRQISDQTRLELGLILKGDTQGSLEAVASALREIKSEKVQLNIISSSIGNITATDVQRATAGDAMIVGFHVTAEHGVAALARHHGVKIRTFRIIYELIDRIRQDMLDLIEPEYKEVFRGRAQVRKVFSMNRKEDVAGCLVLKGVIRASGRVRVMRGKVQLHDGRIETLHHFQDEVSEVREAQECGILVKGFDAFKEGDMIECYEFEEMERAL